MGDRFSATYEVESPAGLNAAAAAMGGEQSTGTFVRLAAETEALRSRSGARVEKVLVTGAAPQPTLPCRVPGTRFEQGRITISWPVDTIGPSLPNLLATVAGNLFELAQLSALRLVALDLPASFAAAHPGPCAGVAGTRHLIGSGDRPIIGTIIKPSVGLSPGQTADLAGDLARAGLDFIKDDELQADGPACPLADRAGQVLARLAAHADKTGHRVMYAVNITGEIDEMARRAEWLEKMGATCLMVSLNWIGLPALAFLRARTGLPIHGHRNGWGLFSRSPGVGIAYPVMQALWRLAGADHLHVNGLANKFTESDAVVMEAARAVQTPLPGGIRPALPVFSSGQTVWQVGETLRQLGNADLLICAGGGIMSHPGGAAAGVTAFRAAAEAAQNGQTLRRAAPACPELAAALDAFAVPEGWDADQA